MKHTKHFVDAFSNLLVNRKLLKPIDAQSLAKTYHDQDDVTFEEFLLDQNLVTKEDLLEAMTQYFGVPAIDLEGEFIEHYIVHLFPKDVMWRMGFIPHHYENDTIFVVAADPLNPDLASIIEQYIYHDVVFYVGLLSDIRAAIEEYWDSSITPQPQWIQNQLMERSAIDAHPSDQLVAEPNKPIPVDVEETIDDYESH